MPSATAKLDSRRALGQYMTPPAVVEQMVAAVKTPCPMWRILDPACGDGNLLVEAAQRLRRAGVDDIPRRIVGVEIDPLLAQAARFRLAELLDCDPYSLSVYEGDY